jgi:hypothetical protein
MDMRSRAWSSERTTHYFRQNRTLGQGRGQARSRTQITCSGAVRAATQARGLPHLPAAQCAFSLPIALC